MRDDGPPTPLDAISGGEEPWRGRITAYLEDNAATWTAIGRSLEDGPRVDHDTFVIFGLLEATARRWTLVHRRVLGDFGLNHSEWTTISMLRTSPPAFRRSPTELRHLVGQTSAGMARILDKLAHAGLVTREPRPEDRRGLDVVLSAQGCVVAEASFRALHRAQRDVVSLLAPSDRAAAIGALERLQDALEVRAPGEDRDLTPSEPRPTPAPTGGAR